MANYPHPRIQDEMLKILGVAPENVTNFTMHFSLNQFPEVCITSMITEPQLQQITNKLTDYYLVEIKPAGEQVPYEHLEHRCCEECQSECAHDPGFGVE